MPEHLFRVEAQLPENFVVYLTQLFVVHHRPRLILMDQQTMIIILLRRRCVVVLVVVVVVGGVAVGAVTCETALLYIQPEHRDVTRKRVPTSSHRTFLSHIYPKAGSDKQQICKYLNIDSRGDIIRMIL